MRPNALNAIEFLQCLLAQTGLHSLRMLCNEAAAAAWQRGAAVLRSQLYLAC